MTLEEPTVVPDVSAHTVSPGKQAAQAVASTNTENGHADEKKPSDAAPAVVSEKEAVPAATIPDKVHIPQVSPASAEADAPAATDTKAETDDKAEADVKAETDGKAETNGKAEAKAPSKVKFGAVEEVPAADVAAEEDDEDYVPGKEGEDEMEDDDNEEQVAPLNLPKGLVSHLMTTGNLGSKPLHAAVQKDNADEIRKLLGKGGEMEGKVDDADPFLYTALHAAAEQGAAKACEVLLKFGANKDLPTKMHDSTPLHYGMFQVLFFNSASALLNVCCQLTFSFS